MSADLAVKLIYFFCGLVQISFSNNSFSLNYVILSLTNFSNILHLPVCLLWIPSIYTNLVLYTLPFLLPLTLFKDTIRLYFHFCLSKFLLLLFLLKSLYSNHLIVCCSLFGSTYVTSCLIFSSFYFSHFLEVFISNLYFIPIITSLVLIMIIYRYDI